MKRAMVYRVKDRWITVREAARLCGTTENALRVMMSRNRWDLDKTVDHTLARKRTMAAKRRAEARRRYTSGMSEEERRAVEKILEIIGL